MAKKAGKSKGRVARGGKTERAKTPGKTSKVHAEDHIDGCACDFLDSDATPDAELPPARGGVATESRVRRGSGPRM